MRFKRTPWLKKLKTGLKVLAIGVCAAFYLIGNSPFEAFHKIFHQQDSIVRHTVDEEKNSCHRSIYHQENESGCAHKSHITKLDKCKLCHALSHSYHVATFNSSFEFIQSESCTSLKSVAAIAFHFDSNLPSRAPPIV